MRVITLLNEIRSGALPRCEAAQARISDKNRVQNHWAYRGCDFMHPEVSRFCALGALGIDLRPYYRTGEETREATLKLGERISGNEVTLSEVNDFLGHAAVLPAHHPYSATPRGWALTPGRFIAIYSA